MLRSVFLKLSSLQGSIEFCITIPPELGSISGRVGIDTNNDGVPDDWQAGVTVTLTTSVVTENTPTAITDERGEYSFVDVEPDNYYIREQTPSGYLNRDNTIRVSLSEGETMTNLDFMNVPARSVSGTVMTDLDNDGSGDKILIGTTIELFDADDNSAGSATTDENGEFLFSELFPGEYIARVATIPFIQDGYQIDFEVDVDTSMGDVVDVEISVVGTRTITGRAERACYTNAPYESFEQLSIGLYDGDTVVQSTKTAEDGSYTFSNVAPGIFTVRIQSVPDGYASLEPSSNVADTGRYDVLMEPLQTVGTRTAFIDTRASMVYGTRRIGGATIELFGRAGDSIVAKQATARGVRFADLCPGSYTAKVYDIPTGWALESPNERLGIHLLRSRFVTATATLVAACTARGMFQSSDGMPVQGVEVVATYRTTTTTTARSNQDGTFEVNGLAPQLDSLSVGTVPMGFMPADFPNGGLVTDCPMDVGTIVLSQGES